LGNFISRWLIKKGIMILDNNSNDSADLSSPDVLEEVRVARGKKRGITCWH